MANPLKGNSLMADKSGDPLFGDRQANVADPAALTNVSVSITAFTVPLVAQAVTVVSEAATDLDTVAAALKTLHGEVTTLAAATGTLEDEAAVVRTALLNALDVLEEHGLMTAS